MTLDQSKYSMIVYGQRGCGKTLYAKKLAAYFGYEKIVDGWAPCMGLSFQKALYLTDSSYLAELYRSWGGLSKCRIASFESACEEAGIDPAKNSLEAGKFLEAEASASSSYTTEAILAERGSRYGSFKDNSRISQELKDMFDRENQARILRKQLPLQYHQKEALDMIAAKICRIFSGDPDYANNWDDIAGYAQLGKNPR